MGGLGGWGLAPGASHPKCYSGLQLEADDSRWSGSRAVFTQWSGLRVLFSHWSGWVWIKSCVLTVVWIESPVVALVWIGLDRELFSQQQQQQQLHRQQQQPRKLPVKMESWSQRPFPERGVVAFIIVMLFLLLLLLQRQIQR